MVDKLRLNTKLFGFDGVIGRRDYFLNKVYVSIIKYVLFIPILMFILLNAEMHFDFLNPFGLLRKMPLALKIWTFVYADLVFCLESGLMIRRLNDINAGKVNKFSKLILGTIIFLSVLPCKLINVYDIIIFIVTLIMLFKKGKITGKFPYDFTKEFNWGAFFGTWIWGIVNRVYCTLWILPLFWTPFALHFTLICGLKGNEWAYKNGKWKSVEKFNSSQEKQAWFFSILVSLLHVLFVALIIFLAVSLAFSASEGRSLSSSKQPYQSADALDKFVDFYLSDYIEKQEITKTENKFYVSPNKWNKYTYLEKVKIFRAAALNASVKRHENNELTTQSDEYFRTKIYSTTNNELLGEFLPDENATNSENAGLMEKSKAIMQSFKFYMATSE